MAWLFKSEPSDYSYDDLVKDRRTEWDGIKNALALIHLRKVRLGDKILFYHTGKEKAVVGIVRAVTSTREDVVYIAADRRLSKPVSLAAVKKCSALKGFDLVRHSRLSVMPVSDDQWKEIMRLSKKK